MLRRMLKIIVFDFRTFVAQLICRLIDEKKPTERVGFLKVNLLGYLKALTIAEITPLTYGQIA